MDQSRPKLSHSIRQTHHLPRMEAQRSNGWLDRAGRSRQRATIGRVSISAQKAAYILTVSLLGAGISYLVLDPRMGIDDANITMSYARNLANGHGYVYNVGEERVEGSTSLAWTLICTAVFLMSNNPEGVIAFLCLALTAATIALSASIAARLVPPWTTRAYWIAPSLFLCFPAFFGWMIWSLMDITLWVFVITSCMYLLARLLDVGGVANSNRIVGWAFVAMVAIAPVVRPEGIVVSAGICLILILCRLSTGRSIGTLPVVAAAASFGMFAVITAGRVAYFGVAFPNTFYAKTSEDILGQSMVGLDYAHSYFANSGNMALAVLFVLASAEVVSRGSQIGTARVISVAAVILGGLAVYVVLGGDHFGSHRFFLYVLPLAVPIIAASASRMLFTMANSSQVEQIPRARLAMSSAASVVFLLLLATQLASFMSQGGGFEHEFRLAERQRDIGQRLNVLPGSPSVGVIAAGGIRMTFEGHIYDVLGLNWLEMAHAPEVGKLERPKNHGGFDASVFLSTKPDVFIPSLSACVEGRFQPDEFIEDVTGGVISSAAFRSAYKLVCVDGLRFFASNEYSEVLSREVGASSILHIDF